ncbi:MAG: hypothetical protein ACRENP_11095 [Longimicrobiales bacterium]
MEVVRLSQSDCGLLAARYVEHGNSHRRMSQALREAGAVSTADRLSGLRKLEHRFDIDLGLLCHWYARRNDQDTHPVERTIITYLTRAQTTTQQNELWILLDRVRQLRSFLEEGRLVGEPES